MSNTTRSAALHVARLKKQFAPRQLMEQWIPLGADIQSQNVRRVLIDAVGVGVAAASAPYLPVFLTRLGGSNFAIGMLSAMPAFAGLLFAIPVGQFLSGRRNIVPWYSGARLLVIMSYALTGLVPFFVADQQINAILLIWALATIPQTLVNVGFTVVMAGVAGPEGRFYLLSRRWSILGITTAILVAFAGFVLDAIPFPLNYQIVFVVLSLGGLLSYAFSSRIILPDQQQAPRPRGLPLQLRLNGALDLLRDQPDFLRVTATQFVYRFGLAYVLPLLPLFYVRELSARDDEIGLINTVQAGVLLVAYFVWARITKQRGIRFALLVTTFVVGLFPLLLSFTRHIELVVLLAGLAGTFAAGIDLVFFEMLVASFPPEKSATYVGIHQTLQNSAAFIAPLVATALASTIGIVPALAFGGVIRLLGFALFSFSTRH